MGKETKPPTRQTRHPFWVWNLLVRKSLRGWRLFIFLLKFVSELSGFWNHVRLETCVFFCKNYDFVFEFSVRLGIIWLVTCLTLMFDFDVSKQIVVSGTLLMEGVEQTNPVWSKTSASFWDVLRGCWLGFLWLVTCLVQTLCFVLGCPARLVTRFSLIGDLFDFEVWLVWRLTFLAVSSWLFSTPSGCFLLDVCGYFSFWIVLGYFVIVLCWTYTSIL